MIERILSSLLDPIRALSEPDKRIFWPHLLGAALLAAVVWARGPRRRSLLRFVFEPRVWLHRSAREDFVLFLARGVLRVTLFAPFTLAAVPLAASLASRLGALLGPSPLASASSGAALAVFTVALFVVEDFSRFLFHYAAHRVPALWALHQVHHSAEVLTPLTLYRVHPLEGFLNRSRGTLTTALVAGVCAWLFPGNVRALEILGVDALGFLWSFAGGNLRHTHVWLSYGPRIERWLLSPAQHQIHHGVDPRHHGRNFGTAIALWDRLFGMLYVPQGRERVVFGLQPDGRSHGEGRFALFVGPIGAALRSMARRRRAAHARR